MNSSIEKERKMKNKVKYIMAVGLVALAGCTDLDVDIKSQYTEYPSSSDVAVEAKMADVYYAFRSAWRPTRLRASVLTPTITMAEPTAIRLFTTSWRATAV